jgi:hypothetical protein
VLALCIAVCALARRRYQGRDMTEAVIFVAALTALAIAIPAALYGLVGNAPSQKQQSSYRRDRPWNFK